MRDYKQLFINNKLDAILVISEKNRKYFTEFVSSFGYLVLLPDKALFITDPRYYQMALELEKFSIDVRQIASGVSVLSEISQYLADNNVTTLGYEDTELTVQTYNALISNLQKFSLVACGASINNMRQTKDSSELQYITQAQKITDATFADMLKIIRIGMTEQDIAVELMYRIYKNGGEGLAFDSIVASGTNTSMPHAHPTSKKVAEGDALTLDFGAAYKGYCSDMTRTIFLGEPSEELKKIYNIVLLAQQNAISNAYVGMSGGELDSLAREVIVANGYGQYFTHSTGHSLGIDIHEDPRASVGYTHKLCSNMLITVEPGIYIPNVGGVRIEDMLLFTQDEVIDLTMSSKNIIIL